MIKSMQRGSAQLLLILLVALIALGGYLYFSQPKSQVSPSASINPIIKKVENTVTNIKTYSNEQVLSFGNKEFEFQYAKDLTAKEDSEEEFNKRGGGDFRKNFKGYVMYEPGKFLNGVVVLGKDGSYDTNPFALWVFDNPNDLSIDSWFDKYWYYPFLWGVFNYTSKGHVTLDQEATVSGEISKFKIVSYQPGSPKYVYISNSGKMYLFRIIGEDGEKILPTFKFIN